MKQEAPHIAEFSRRTSLFLLSLFLLPSAIAQQQIDELPCLYAMTVGPENAPVSGCQEGDPLDLGNDARVHAAMKILGVPRSAVRFQGCPGHRFSAVEDVRAGVAKKFIVTYPSEVQEKVIAPVVHELAHVMQIRAAEGLDRLKDKMTSLQIELMADFLVGHVFVRAFPNLNRDEFQQNLKLIGAYFDKPHEAHGKPSERAASFRLGAVNAYPYHKLDASKGSDYFVQNHFSLVTGL